MHGDPCGLRPGVLHLWTCVMDEVDGTTLAAACVPFALDGAKYAALLSGDEDTKRIGGIVVAISFVDIGGLDLVACEPFGSFDDGDQRVAAVRIARQMQHELAARRASCGINALS
jgi:hypothetical protein